MAASQSISLRVPQRLLEHLDAIAVERFPTRKDGEPNRSRVILDFIEKGIERTVSDKTPPQSQTLSDNSVEELIRQQVQFQLQIQQMVRQQLEQYSPYSPSFPAITELQLEVAEIKRILKSLVTVDNPKTVSDNSSTISDERSRPERQSQPTTASTQPQSAAQRQSERSRPEQSQPATASMQPESAIQRQSEPLIDNRNQLSDNRDAISDSDARPSQSKPAAASTQVQPQSTSEQLPERDRTELSDSLPDIALQQSDSPSRDRHLTDRRDRPTELSSEQPNVTLQSSDSNQPYSATAISRVDSDKKGARTPGEQPPQKPGNRIVKIETADDLLTEIRWCLANGGYFTQFRLFTSPKKIGYYLEHRAYNDGERPVKTALARELIERKAIYSDCPTKGMGSGTRNFELCDDLTPPEQPHPTTAETHAQQEFQPQSTARQQSDSDCTELSDSPPDIALQQSDSPSRDRHLTTTENDRDRPEPATELSDSQPNVTLQSSDRNQPFSEQLPDRDRHRIATENWSDRLEQSDPATVETLAQQELQPQSTTQQLPDRARQETTASDERDRPEQSHPATIETQAQPQSAAPTPEQLSERDRPDKSAKSSDVVLQLDEEPPETTPESAIVGPEPKTVLQHVPQQSHKPAPEEYPKERPDGKWPGSIIPKDFVKPGQEPQLPSGNRIVEIETASDLLAEIRWCLDNGGDFVFLYEPAHGHLPPRRAYYLRHPEWYWQGIRPVKTALVKELIDRRAIWTNDPAKGPGSGCRRFYPTAPEATPQSAIASPKPDTALHHTTAYTPAQQEPQPQSVIPASDRDRPEQSQTGTVYAPAQQEPQLQSAVPTSEQLPERDHPSSQSHSATASTLAQKSPPQSATLALERSPEPVPDFPEWMTAKQAFQALGGDPGDRNSSISSADGLKQIKFSTFKKKTSSELKPFRLELNQDRKRRRQPCYRLLKML